MPRAVHARYQDREIEIREAVEISREARQRGVRGPLGFKCLKCGAQVLAMKDSAHGRAAHFEHYPHEEGECNLRDPRWGPGRR